MVIYQAIGWILLICYKIPNFGVRLRGRRGKTALLQSFYRYDIGFPWHASFVCQSLKPGEYNHPQWQENRISFRCAKIYQNNNIQDMFLDHEDWANNRKCS